MNIYNLVQEKIVSSVELLAEKHQWKNINYRAIVTESPKNHAHGDLATNAAMVLAKPAQMQPNLVASKIVDALLEEHKEIFEKIEVAGGGFINMILHKSVWQNELRAIIDEGYGYGSSNIGSGKKVNVEFASPNPTGPMHVGHARGAIYGDSLASLLEYAGYDVVREYYVNDAGNQINVLTKSLFIRYLELLDKYEGEFPEGCYPGSYLIDAAKKLQKEYGSDLLNINETERDDIFRKFAIEYMMGMIKKDLKALGVEHDVFFYESELHKNKKIQEALTFLKEKDLIYRGVLTPPKGKLPDDWEEREQLLFKSTEYGDDIDRPLQKSDGSWTYFAADMAYLQNKLQREFSELILVLGADHIGYQKRMEAACRAFNNGENILDVKLCQLVSFMKDGVPFKMSKRSGNFLGVNEILKMVSKDVMRFIMLAYNNETVIDFDFVKVTEQSKDNPVFYVQYANARGHSVIKNSEEQNPQALAKVSKYLQDVDLSLLAHTDELDLIKLLIYFPKQVELAAVHHDPHRIVFYLQNLATKFHALWNKGKDDKNLRFIIVDDVELTSARLTLVKATTNIISSGLKLIGVTPIEKM